MAEAEHGNEQGEHATNMRVATACVWVCVCVGAYSTDLQAFNYGGVQRLTNTHMREAGLVFARSGQQ